MPNIMTGRLTTAIIPEKGGSLKSHTLYVTIPTGGIALNTFLMLI
jgi:hypothetical protein